MNIDRFIIENNVEQSDSLVDQIFLKKVENQIGLTFGKELSGYLLKYGYLAFEYVELYGINSRQKFCSDMIKQTLYLHKHFSETASFIVLENQGDGLYCLIDKDDNVYEYDSVLKSLKSTQFTLFNYILFRFTNAK